MNLIDRIFPSRFARRSLASHLGDVFAIEPGHLAPAVEEARARLATMTADDVRALSAESDERPGIMAREGSTAIIPVVGTIVRGDASCAREWGMNATGLGEIEAALRAAAADATIDEVVMAFDSPGGTGTGLTSISALIDAVRARKPVRAVVHGLCASAAYWLASACESIEAEPSALVGSIGVYSVIEDSSKMAEAIGVKVHVLRSHELKGAGVPGAPVTSAQLASAQRVVDELAAMFVAQVAQGRRMSAEAARAVATGEVWTAGVALAKGLIDALSTVELDALEANTITAPAMAESTNAPTGATTEEKMQKDAAPVSAVDAGADEIAQLREELAREKAAREKAEAVAESFANAKKDAARARIDAAIERHAKAGTFAPSERPSIEKLAAKFSDDPEGFEEHLDQRAAVSGSVVRREPVGKTVTEPDADAEIAARDAALEAELSKRMGISAETARATRSLVGVSQSHQVIAAEQSRTEV